MVRLFVENSIINVEKVSRGTSRKVYEGPEKDERAGKDVVDAESGIDAGTIEALVRNLKNFGGIFEVDQLDDVKIVSFPVGLIILDREHWLAIYIDDKTVEIMDSLGVKPENLPVKLCRFLRGQLVGRRLSATPQLQSTDSNCCGLYALCFLFYRVNTNFSLCDFSEIFTSDFHLNCIIIKYFFSTIFQ